MDKRTEFSIRKAGAADLDVVQRVVKRYYDEVGVVVLDSRSDLEHYDIWLAWRGGEAIGCIFLRDLPSVAAAGEIKRMYVDPAHRGLGIGQALFDAVEEHARSTELRWIYLDTRDDLRAAISCYLRNGFEHCERYNDNREATIFMRKPVPTKVIEPSEV